MRLRGSIHPPERYNAEEFYTPFTPNSVRERSQRAPNYVNYNQNLPLAAFPTLDKPRTLEICNDRSGEDIVDDGSGDKGTGNVDNATFVHKTRRDSLPTETNVSHHYGVEGGSFHNYMMEPDSPIYDLDWSHLSPQLQVEIFNNLLQHHEWSSVCRMLGIIEHEEQLIYNLLLSRNAQALFEDTCLENARQRQLNNILRRDNSVKQSGKSNDRLFYKISEETTQLLAKIPGIDCFSCSVPEVTKAKLFIHKRAIDPWVVGEWNNNIITLASHSVRGGSYPGRLPTRGLAKDNSGICAIKDNGSKHSMPPRIGGMKYAKSEPTDSPHRPEQWDQESTTPSSGQDPHQYVKNRRLASQSPWVVRLKIGVQRAAQIQDLEEARFSDIEPDKLYLSFPPLDRYYLNQPLEIEARTNDHHRRDGPEYPRQEFPVAWNLSGPLRRRMGGIWSYNSIEPSLKPLKSPMKLRERLENAHLEAQEQKQQAKAAQGVHGLDTFSHTHRVFISGVQSPPASPGRIVRGDGVTEFPPNRCPIPSDRFDTPPYSEYLSGEVLDEESLCSSEYIPITPPDSAIRPSFASFTEDSDGQNENQEKYEEYGVDDEDEIVLVGSTDWAAGNPTPRASTKMARD